MKKLAYNSAFKKLRSWPPVSLLMANRWGNNGNSDRLLYFGALKSLQIVISAMKLKDTHSLEEEL